MTTGADGPPIDENAFRLDLIGVVLEDRYRVESVLGEGGMASVYLATDLRLSRSVVVKVPHTRFLAEKGFRERFSLEISSLVSAEHPSVVKVLDAGVVRGVPYAVLQHLSGGSLHDRLAASRGTMTAAEIDAWLTPVAAALDSVHKKGIVHRDVKPGNILFDGDHNAYLADFGIAKVLAATGGSMTTAGSTVGSPDYMGPELANGEVLTPAYDQYALGVIVYQALSGRLPFEGGTPVQTLVQKASSPPRPLGEVSSGVPSEAVDAVMQSLSVDVEARFPTCSWFAIAFRLASGVPALHPRAAPGAILGVHRCERRTRDERKGKGAVGAG